MDTNALILAVLFGTSSPCAKGYPLMFAKFPDDLQFCDNLSGGVVRENCTNNRNHKSSIIIIVRENCRG